MSSVFSNNSPILITYRKGNDVDPYVQYSHDVVVSDEGIAVLIEIPNEFTHVRIDGMDEKQMDYYNKDLIKENEYVVDYRMGFVYFNPIMKGETVRVEYDGVGVVLYPASRIYIDGKKNVITTIQDMINGGKSAIEAYGNIDNAIKVAEEYYMKINSSIEDGKVVDDKLNTTIINAKEIDDTLNTTIINAKEIDDTLNGSILNGNNKITEINNKIIEVDNNEKIRQTNESDRQLAEINRESRLRNKLEEYTNTFNEKETKRQETFETNENARVLKNSTMINNFYSSTEKYDNNKEYKKYNRVEFNGSSYECIKDCKSILPTENEYWICIAEKGQDGNDTGNMHTDTYDKNGNGVVDNAEVSESANSVEWTNVQNRPDVEKLQQQLSENATKTVTDTSNIVHMTNSVDGLCNVEIGGNTRYKRVDGTYTDVWESDCTLESVGELEGNKIEALTKNTDGTKQDKIDILTTVLRGFNNVRDLASGDTVTRKIGKRAYQTGDETNTAVITDKVNTLYVLDSPTIEKLPQPLTLQSFANGTLQVNTAIPPVVTVKYPSNINSRLSNVEEVNNTMLNSLGNAWKDMAKLAGGVDKIGDLSTLEKEIIDNLTTEKKDINLTNAINYLYQNGGGGNVQLGAIQNLTAISNIEGTKATLSWQNPIATEFQKTEIYASINDLTSANYDYCTKNATKIVDSNITNFDYNTTNGTYYFKAFAVYSIFGVMQNSDGVITSVIISDTKPPSIITNIKAIIGNAEVTLSWTNPNDSDFSKVKIVRKEGSKPTNETDGTMIYEGGLTTYKDTGLTNGTNYYYRFFTYDTNNNVNNTDTQFVNAIPLANGYDKPISNFSVQTGNAEVNLSWTNPTDVNFNKVMIRRKLGGYPNGITDGDLVYEGNSTSYKNTGLTNGTQYYYRAFTFSANSQYCDITSGQQVTATPQAFKEYGIRWTKSTDTIERLGNAIGKTAITGGQNDFNSLLPWSGIKRCNLSDNGIVNSYYGNPTYKTDGSNEQVMVEIPKYWYKVVNVSDDIVEFWICDGAKSGYEVHPAFFRDRLHLCDDNSGTATEVDNRYIGAYDATEYTGSVYQGGNGYDSDSLTYNSNYKLSSVSGFYPIANRSLSQFRTLAKNRGNGWSQQDYYLTYAIQLLYLVEYAHFNSQEKIGNGNSKSSTILKTGTTDSYGNNSYGITANTSTAMSYRGIENFYGNVYKYLDGLYSDGNRKVFFANKGFTDTCTNYNNSYATGLSANINGHISDIWGDKTMGFIPKVVSGSQTTKLCDYGSLCGGCVAIFGGYFGGGAACGCFSLNVSDSPSDSYWSSSARLAF